MGLGSDASSSSSRLDSAPLLPHHSAEGGHLSSQPKTFANVFIAVVGAGVLGLPYTFSRTGWAAGSILLLSVALLTFYCMMLLVACRRRLADDHPKMLSSFGDLGDAVFGAPGRLAVDTMLVLSQASFCVGSGSTPSRRSRSSRRSASSPTSSTSAPWGSLLARTCRLGSPRTHPSPRSAPPPRSSTARACPYTPSRASVWSCRWRRRPRTRRGSAPRSGCPWRSSLSCTGCSVSWGTSRSATPRATSSLPTSAAGGCRPPCSWGCASTSSSPCR
uniref:Amino acid transporter transmembrane domain-containing protein n=1 Tax=Aegilops tauschii subsp. strangulata TaxID=200361 RepID=A0A453P978_AEGTS